MYVGIDPGKRGGICFLNKQGLIEHLQIMPAFENLAVLLENSRELIMHVCVEKSQSFSQQGLASTFNYGVGYGIIQGILITLKIKHSLVPPRTWQKNIIYPSKHTDPKKKALQSANRIFKKKSEFWLPTSRHRVPHDGLIDSALIAKYCFKFK